MTEFGYTALCEQTPVRQLVGDIAAAEQAGFDFAVMSDHYFPWLEEQGHSGYTWSVLGAAAQATTRIPLMSFVTCPSFRYHPAVVAQKAATMGLLSNGRFTLGLGAGENLNEHVVGAGWPMTRARHERLRESVQIIRKLFSGDYVNFSGRHFTVERAKLFDLPEKQVPIGIAASGGDSVALAADLGDCLIAAEPDASLVRGFASAGGKDKRTYTQIPLCYDADTSAARDRAVHLWRWSATGWHVMSELPEPRSFDAASANVTADDIAETVACGPDVKNHVAAVHKAIEAGYTHIALVQIGADRQGKFTAWASSELLPALRELATSRMEISRENH
ncbi:MAG TPA: TIGR03557 family F420-dependent LLM class oxidoreductase [Streptosporangiaceae bacterium]|nr:TIGR03557 family F420-dependent LLM class oxidoreductase [Streptosporangiaceae bacterium]